MAPIVRSFSDHKAARDGAIAQLGERVVRNDEVGGSIPPGSTSLRLLSQATASASHTPANPREASEGCRVVARRAKTGFGKRKPSAL